MLLGDIICIIIIVTLYSSFKWHLLEKGTSLNIHIMFCKVLDWYYYGVLLCLSRASFICFYSRLSGDDYGSCVMFSDGENIGHVASSKDVSKSSRWCQMFIIGLVCLAYYN